MLIKISQAMLQRTLPALNTHQDSSVIQASNKLQEFRTPRRSHYDNQKSNYTFTRKGRSKDCNTSPRHNLTAHDTPDLAKETTIIDNSVGLRECDEDGESNATWEPVDSSTVFTTIQHHCTCNMTHNPSITMIILVPWWLFFQFSAISYSHKGFLYVWEKNYRALAFRFTPALKSQDGPWSHNMLTLQFSV
jgi:hypothetical protein